MPRFDPMSDDDPGPGPGDVGRLDASAIVEALAARLDRTRDRRHDASGHAASADGRVRVGVDGHGALTELVLDDTVADLSPAELAAAILAVSRAAVADLESAFPTPGARDVDVTGAMLADLGSEFRAQAGSSENLEELRRRLADGP
jgi:hypothetical protein